MILFIDELHTIVGAGSAEGAVDAANILKPALGRGEIQVIGATTLNEYRKYIEKDAALERRFQPVQVGEPSQEASLEILKGLREKYEAHHKPADHRRGPGGRREAVRPVYHRPLPAGQGHRPDGRGCQPGADGDGGDLPGAEEPGGEDRRPGQGQGGCHREAGL